MDNFDVINRDWSILNVTDTYRPYVEQFLENLKLGARVRILFVVDDEISLTPSPGAFGVGRVVQLIRATSAACRTFTVDLARRSELPAATNASPSEFEPKYTGFRFDQNNSSGNPIINSYNEIWCFGFKPDNFDDDDGNINQPGAFPISDAELKVLTKWMNEKRGGIFATGDHDYLGASMCARIPRVGTMRKWTNADGVPPIGGPDRIDTNRPANAAQADIDGNPPVPEEIPNDVQSDEIPQPIEWVPWLRNSRFPFVFKRRPHPVLCHPKLGPINVMPDHPHEGLCFDTKIDPATGVPEIKLDGTYDFDGYAGDEYPSSGRFKPKPTVIAYGKTLPDPPYNFEKGDSPEKRFPMISVYDGHQINVGRVAVDSTWHHWMDMNISGIEADTVNPNNWRKIRQYFINLAVWLAPPLISRFCFTAVIFQSQFEYFGFEEVSPKLSPYQIGKAFKSFYGKLLGPCWITDSVLDWVKISDAGIYKRLFEEFIDPELPPDPNDPQCLSCPPFEMLENAVLGGMILQAHEMLVPVRRKLGADKKLAAKKPMDPAAFEKQLIAGANRGLNVFMKSLETSMKTSRERFLSK